MEQQPMQRSKVAEYREENSRAQDYPENPSEEVKLKYEQLSKQYPSFRVIWPTYGRCPEDTVKHVHALMRCAGICFQKHTYLPSNIRIHTVLSLLTLCITLLHTTLEYAKPSTEAPSRNRMKLALVGPPGVCTPTRSPARLLLVANTLKCVMIRH